MKEILYYTCLTHADNIEQICRTQLLKAELPIIAVSRNVPIDFGQNIVVVGERSAETMHRQILAGIQGSTADYLFLCESDVLYHSSHFEFTPPNEDTFYFNTNVWKYHIDDKKYYWTDDLQQVSGICASRTLLLDFFSERVAQIEEGGFDGHYEPRGNTENWQSEFPNICIRHENTLTKTKKSSEDFRNQKFAKGWKESDSVIGWGKIEA